MNNDPRLFPAEGMGVLHSYTVIPGHDIRPQVQQGIDFATARLDHLPFVSDRAFEPTRHTL